MTRMIQRKQKQSARDTITLRKYKIGQRVVGKRDGSFEHGVLVDAYVTLNNVYRNPAYVVLCDRDNKKRSYQWLEAE